MPQGLPRKLRYAFVLQAAMASFAIVIGIFAVSMFAKDILAVDRLHTEADAWRAGRAGNPAYPLPRTSTVSGWYLPTGADPSTLDIAVCGPKGLLHAVRQAARDRGLPDRLIRHELFAFR